jgi:hypothetical protein
MKLLEGFGIRGHVSVTHRKADGTLVGKCEQSNLVTNVGWDWLYAQMSGTPGAAATYIALTSNTDAAGAGNSSLASEYTDFGLERAAATPAHTASAKTYTLTKIFTCTADTKVVAKAALFNASSGPTMILETKLTTEKTLSTTDTLTVTWTITMGT